MARHAKAMDVYGPPPSDILAKLSQRQIAALDKYIGGLVEKVYRTAYDSGRHEATLTAIRLLQSTPASQREPR